MQLIGRNHAVTSARIDVCGKKNLPTLFLYKARMQARRALQWVITWVHTFLAVIMYIYIHSHLASFLSDILCATAACIAMPRLDIDISKRAVSS